MLCNIKSDIALLNIAGLVHPSYLMLYLKSLGARFMGVAEGKYAMYEYPMSVTWLDVPLSSDIDSYPLRFVEILNQLSDLEHRTPVEVIRDIISRDIISLGGDFVCPSDEQSKASTES